MVVRLAGAFLLALLTFSCASLPGGGDLAPSGEGRVSPGGARSIGGPEELITDLSPRDGKPVFLGIAARRRNREDEELDAIRHVAEQASRYGRLGARYAVSSRRTSRRTAMIDDVITQWDEDGVDALMEDVTVVQSFSDNAGTYILATVDGLSAPPADVGSWPHRQTGEPSWVTQPPELPGYLVAVGVEQRRRDFRDSMDSVDQAALTELLLQSGATIRLRNESRTVDGVGTKEEAVSFQEASTVLRGFYVVARYASSDGRTVYSLAVAQEE